MWWASAPWTGHQRPRFVGGVLAHYAWVMIRGSLVDGFRVSPITVIISSFGSFEFLIIRHKLKYSL